MHTQMPPPLLITPRHKATIPCLSTAATATANGSEQRRSTRPSCHSAGGCCAEKTEYCNVPGPARRSLVQRKQ
uniref:Uncharacterized protein n=1 Tax=Arundo donax TaxID=35708 RepID=A0A0A9E3J7_ARUDO